MTVLPVFFNRTLYLPFGNQLLGPFLSPILIADNLVLSISHCDAICRWRVYLWPELEEGWIPEFCMHPCPDAQPWLVVSTGAYCWDRGRAQPAKWELSPRVRLQVWGARACA